MPINGTVDGPISHRKVQKGRFRLFDGSAESENEEEKHNANFFPLAVRRGRASYLNVVRMAELVDEPLRAFRLTHYALFVVLAEAARQLVVVHGRPVLAASPETGHRSTVLDLEHTTLPVQPPDHLLLAGGGRFGGRGVGRRATDVVCDRRRTRGFWLRGVCGRRSGQQFFEKLPQVDVLRRRRRRRKRRRAGCRRLGRHGRHGRRQRDHSRCGRRDAAIRVVRVVRRGARNCGAGRRQRRCEIVQVHRRGGRRVARTAWATADAAGAAGAAAATTVAVTSHLVFVLGLRGHHDGRHQQSVVVVVVCRQRRLPTHLLLLVGSRRRVL